MNYSLVPDDFQIPLLMVFLAYSVMSLDESKCLGCVYIYPSKNGNFDAEVYLWVRQSELSNGLEQRLFRSVKEWMAEKWPFQTVDYPVRRIDTGARMEGEGAN